MTYIRTRYRSWYRRRPWWLRRRMLFVGGAALWVKIGDWYGMHRVAVLTALPWVALLAGGLLLGSLAIWLWARQAAATRRASVDATFGVGTRTGGPLERRTGALLRRDGATDVRVTGGACDRGLDVSAWYPGYGLMVAQCKAYSPNHKVSSPDMSRFLGTCWDVIQVDGRHADVAVFVTTSTFTVEARALGEMQRMVRGRMRSVLLIDGPLLRQWDAGLYFLSSFMKVG